VISISDVTRQTHTRKILDSVSLEIQRGEIFTLIGPSGSGKTSLLRCIDLLDFPTSGTILFDGTDTTTASNADKITVRRRMAMVFQKPAILNTTVAGNVAFGLKFRGVSRDERDRRIYAALDLVGLADLAGRRAITLSGGEMQRVALARAMVTEPDVLLLDEPTANLDPVNSELIEDLIIRINRKFHTTIILSTHDMVQGQRLANRIGVIMDGRIAQVGTLHDIFYRPNGKEIARFVGVDTVLSGEVKSCDDGHCLIRVQNMFFEAIASATTGQRATLFIRPEEINLTLPDDGRTASSVRNQLHGTITKIVALGPFVRVTVDCGPILIALVTRRSSDELGLEVGKTVQAGVKATAIHVVIGPT
jgi:tungstate transport system ATP-binding protein